MDRLLTVEDIMTRYRCSAQTARKYMRQMYHMEKPLMVAESAVAAGEREKTVMPARPEEKRKPKRVKFEEWVPGMKIPRRIA